MEEFKLFHKSKEVYYYVSNFGNVRSFRVKTMKTLLLKPAIGKTRPGDKQGYLQIRILKNNRYQVVRIHTLVAKYFVIIKGPKGYKEVNHKDGNKHNNHFKNLEWVSKSENTQHAIATGLFKPNTDGILRSNRRKINTTKYDLSKIKEGILLIREKNYTYKKASLKTNIPVHTLRHFNKRSPLFAM